ncbi:hypothetical protein BGZ93_003710, partial [Podila epicladia]
FNLVNRLDFSLVTTTEGLEIALTAQDHWTSINLHAPYGIDMHTAQFQIAEIT